IAPAMHTEMWQHPSTQDNIAILRARGVHTVGPDSGRLTGDDSGAGRMSEPDQIAARAYELLGSLGVPAAAGQAAGPTEVPDPSPAIDVAATTAFELPDDATRALGAIDLPAEAPWFAQEPG